MTDPNDPSVESEPQAVAPAPYGPPAFPPPVSQPLPAPMQSAPMQPASVRPAPMYSSPTYPPPSQPGQPVASAPPVKPRSYLALILAAVAVVLVSAIVVGVITVATLIGRVSEASGSGSTTSSAPGDSSGTDGSGDSVAGWEDYPGSAWYDSADVLAQPSKEVTMAAMEQYVDDTKAALSAEFGFSWDETYDASDTVSSNSYGGDSMLSDYESPVWQGSVALDDPTARQRASDIMAAVAEADGFETPELSNDSYSTDSDDVAAAKQQFGAEARADQPLWSFSSYGTNGENTSLYYDIYDRNLPADPSFTGGNYFTLDDSSGTFVISFSASAYGQLAAADHDTFAAQIDTYDEANKPDGID